MKMRKFAALMLTLCMMLSLSISAFAASDTIASGTIPDSKIKWELDSHGWLTISGSGEAPVFQSADDQPWAEYREQITEVWYDDMSTLTISDLAYWFEGCSDLTTAELPLAPVIGRHAFYNCPKLSTLTMYYGETVLNSIGEDAFWREADAGDTLYIAYIIGYERKLVGVILYHHLANAYWPEGSEYDDNVPPFCQSFDGKQGYGEPGGVCAACAFNQFGSTANGSGKACKNMRQIYLLRSGEYLPLQLSLPPTSLRPFNDFMNLAFVARRRPSYSAIVEIGLKRAESGGYTYSVATFRKVRDLEGEGLAAVKSYAANFKEQVKSLLAQRVENYKSDVESLTGTTPLELADNGDHFSYPGVIDGERDELPL